MYSYKFNVCAQTDQAKILRLLQSLFSRLYVANIFADNFNDIQLYFHLRTALVSLFA